MIRHIPGDNKGGSSVRDRLIKVFRELRKEGFLARANFMCCRNCAGSELARKAEELYEKGKRVKGAIYWTRQDETDLRNRGRMYISYGSCITRKYGAIGLPTEEVGRKLCENSLLITFLTCGTMTLLSEF